MNKYLDGEVTFSKRGILIAGAFAIGAIVGYVKEYNSVCDKAAHLGQYLVNEKGLTLDEIKEVSEGKYESHED